MPAMASTKPTQVDERYPLDKWGAPMHPAFKGKRFMPSRRKTIFWLAANGPIEWEPGKSAEFGSNYPGISPGWLQERIGLPGKKSSVPGLFRDMELEGIVERTIYGKLTRRLALTPKWAELMSDVPNPPAPEPDPEPVPAAEDPVRKLRAVADELEIEEPSTNGSDQRQALAEAHPPMEIEPWPEEVVEAKPDLSGFGFTQEQINHVAHALLGQAVEAINTAREAASNDGGLVEHLEHRVSELLEDNSRLRKRLDESRDYNKALHTQLDVAKRDRTQLQITADALVKQLKKMPPPTDDLVLRELVRLMRQVPRMKG